MNTYTYDTDKYNFKALIQSLHSPPLDEWDDNDLNEVFLGTDTHTTFHKLFYDKLDDWDEFKNLYFSFVKNEVFPKFCHQKQLVYQTLPNLRLQQPHRKAVQVWHEDGDALHKHPAWEVNVFLPLTKCFETNTMWTESLPGLGDYKPIELSPGQFVLFDGNKCAHGNKENLTGKTRISFDFRVIPYTKYNPHHEALTATTKQRFIVGEYYEVMSK